jgi:hypothetical protein
VGELICGQAREGSRELLSSPLPATVSHTRLAAVFAHRRRLSSHVVCSAPFGSLARKLGRATISHADPTVHLTHVLYPTLRQFRPLVDAEGLRCHTAPVGQ